MQTTIRTAEPRELLALIPFQLGFEPQDSAVVVSLRGSRGQVGLVARVDLDDLTDADRGPQVARSLVSHLVADGARRAVVVLYTDLVENAEDAGAEGLGTVAGRRAHEHLAEAAEHFLGRPDCWVVGATGYLNLTCTDAACCPPGGRPLTDLQSTEVGAQMVLEGASVAGSRGELGRIVPAPAEARRSARRAAVRWAARGREAQGGSPLHRWRREGLMLWRAELRRACEALGTEAVVEEGGVGGDRLGDRAADRGRRSWTPPPSASLGRLQASIADVLVRDAVMLSFVPGTERVGDKVVAGDGGAEVGHALRAIIDPVEGVGPDARLVRGARAVLEEVVAHSARRAQAPALTLLAVLAWWEGDGARAGILVGRALAAEPGHRLAVLIDETLAVGMAPGWLRPADGAVRSAR